MIAKSSILSWASRGGRGAAVVVGAGEMVGRAERVDGSMGPRIWVGLRVSSRVPGG